MMRQYSEEQINVQSPVRRAPSSFPTKSEATFECVCGHMHSCWPKNRSRDTKACLKALLSLKKNCTSLAGLTRCLKPRTKKEKPRWAELQCLLIQRLRAISNADRYGIYRAHRDLKLWQIRMKSIASKFRSVHGRTVEGYVTSVGIAIDTLVSDPAQHEVHDEAVGDRPLRESEQSLLQFQEATTNAACVPPAVSRISSFYETSHRVKKQDTRNNRSNDGFTPERHVHSRLPSLPAYENKAVMKSHGEILANAKLQEETIKIALCIIERKPYSCPICNDRFHNIAALTTHIKSGSHRRSQCPPCLTRNNTTISSKPSSNSASTKLSGKDLNTYFGQQTILSRGKSGFRPFTNDLRIMRPKQETLHSPMHA
mmetsp:Transcript_7868/g.11023  ORF Transcript_7868/g.11023 Transcript_7868/m.11023 type:complete len:370 (-) Transcript_7868:452-1561(-)